MRPECIEALINENREIEFVYKNKEYSISYYNDHRKKYISVCQAYKKPIDVSSAIEVLRLKIGNKTLEKIFLELPDSAFDIY